MSGRKLPSALGFALLVAGKDLRLEWKSREILVTMGFFALVVVLVFAFAFVPGDATRLAPGVVAGVLWATLLFAGVVGLGRTFDRERDGEAIRSLLLSPAPRGALYLGKLAAIVVLMLVVEVPVTLLAALLFRAPIDAHPLWLAALLGCGTLGFAAVGTVFSAALLRSKTRDVLLSSLLFPLALPVLMVGVRATAVLLGDTAGGLDEVRSWTLFLAGMDAILLAVGVWLFEPVATGE